MKKRALIACIFLVFLTILSIISLTPICNGENETVQLNVTMYVQIGEINPANHTVLANISLYMDNFPDNITTNILLRFAALDVYEVNCSRIDDPSGTFNFKGELNGKYWYLVTYGELYPSDINFVNFKLMPKYLVGSINGTTYNPDWEYSLNVVNGEVSFYGSQWSEYQDTWKTTPVNSSERLIVYFERQQIYPQYIIIVPLVWFISLVAAMPLLSRNKKIKIEFYSSMLVFAPVFIFAIQTFIPARSSLSIPEYLGFILIFASTLMLILTLPKSKNERVTRNLELGGLIFLMFFSFAIGVFLYWRFLILAETKLGVFVVLLIISLIFGVMAYCRDRAYRKQISIEESLEY